MKVVLLAVFCCVLIACGTEPQPKPEPETPTILDAQLETLEKAKSVENKLEQAVKEREKKMRENGT